MCLSDALVEISFFVRELRSAALKHTQTHVGRSSPEWSLVRRRMMLASAAPLGEGAEAMNGRSRVCSGFAQNCQSGEARG